MHPAVDTRLQHHAVVLAEVLNFSEAAKRLHIAQPALSKSIRQLEEFLGVVLFVRTSRKVTLTEAGQKFVEEARKALHHSAQAIEAATEAAQKLVFGHPSLFDTRFLLDINAISIPGTPLKIVPRTSTHAEIIAKILSGEFDFGIIGLPERHSQIGDCKIVPLFRYPLTAAIPAAHPLASEQNLSLTALKGEPLIFLAKEQNPAFYEWFCSKCLASGFSPTIARFVADAHEFAALVYHGVGIGIGVALVKDCPMTKMPDNVVVRSFREPHLAVETAAIFGPKFKSARLKPFIKAILRLRDRYREASALSQSA